MTTLNDIAPRLESTDDVTAHTLARSCAIDGQRLYRRVMAEMPPADAPKDQHGAWHTTMDAAAGTYGMALLLRAFAEHAPEAADRVAKRLWNDWEDGGACGEWLWQWLTEYGVDPAQVAREEP